MWRVRLTMFTTEEGGGVDATKICNWPYLSESLLCTETEKQCAGT
jgi:hypothetical protein